MTAVAIAVGAVWPAAFAIILPLGIGALAYFTATGCRRLARRWRP